MSTDPRASIPIRNSSKSQQNPYAMSRSTYRTASPSVQEPGQISRHEDSDTYAPLGSYTNSPPRVDVPSWGPPLSTTLSSSRPTPLSVATGGWTQDRPGSYGTARTAVGRSRSTTGTQTEAPAVTYSPPSTISTISTASSISSSSRSAHRQQTLSNPPNAGKQPAPLEWENVFHPSFIPNIADFANEWSFTGLYTSHILFTQHERQPPFKKLLIYNIRAQTTEITKVKYDTAGLGPGGVFLLYRQGYEMHLYDVTTGTTIKSASLRNLTRWSYNALGFCILDDAGNFWRWSFNDRLPPALVFRLANRAPKARLRCLTTRDGSWNAIVAVSRDRTEGLVHCYPTDNDESRVFPGVLAALMQTEIDGNRVTHIAVIEIDSESETEDPTMIFTINQLGSPVPGAIRRVETRMPFEAVGGPPSAMFIDSEQAVAVVLITPPTDNYIAMLFDLRTGTFLMKQNVAKYQEDSWLVDDTGIFRERSGCVVQRLKILAEGLPPRVSAQPRGGLPPLSPTYGRAGDREHLSPVSPLSGQHSPQMPPRKLSLPVMANDVGVGY